MDLRAYDETIEKVVPNYRSMLQTIVEVLPFEMHEPIRVLDLGSGTGNLANAIISQFPNASVRCVDTSEEALDVARKKITSPYALFQKNTFEQALQGQYDAVISSIALHHVPTEGEKRALFKNIFDSLTPRGVFYNGDWILGKDDLQKREYLGGWRTFLSKSFTTEEIAKIQAFDSGIPETEAAVPGLLDNLADDHPFRLVDELSWLRETGFKDVGMRWQNYSFAVYGGRKNHARI